MKKNYEKVFISGIILIFAIPIILRMPTTLDPTYLIECDVPTIGETISYNMIESKMLRSLRNKDYNEILNLLNENPKLSSEMIKDRKKDLITYSDNKSSEYYYSKELVTKTYPLHIASSIYPSKKIVELIIEKNAYINALDHSGKTALDLAILFQQYEICKMLINSGADVNIKDNSGMSAIHYAVIIGDTKYVDLILDNGGNINDIIEGNSSEKGETPLLLALDYKYDKYNDNRNITTLEYINEILNRGANLKVVEDIMFLKSFIYCKEFSYRMLENGYKMKKEYYSEIAREAISNGSIDIAKSLLDDGFDIHKSIEPSYYGAKYSPLTWALHNHNDANNNLEMVEFLISNGANIYFKFDSESNSAIEYVDETKNLDKEILVNLYNKYN